MKWCIYNILFALLYPFLLPGFLVRMIRRGGYAARMGDRFALYPQSVKRALLDGGLSDGHDFTPGEFVWIHAVSVGEVQVAGQLMREWRQIEPKIRFCLSTTSSTGWKTAEREVTDRDVLIYNPLDFPTFVKAALLTVRPRAVILTESEIWPNFILKAKKLDIPIFLINARVSDRSAPRYRAARVFFRPVLSAFTRIFAQSDLDRDRLVAAGAPAGKVVVTGSFKFDVARRNPAKERELAAWLGEDAVGRRVLLGGSTWPGEDEALLRIYRDLCAAGEKALLVLAPRHFEKADAVEANIVRFGFGCVRRSRGETAERSERKAGGREERKEKRGDAAARVVPVFLADTTGELMGLYGIADVVFVGKSLCAHGSQNMIEPCLCGKPTIVGPYTENFRPVMSDLVAARAIVQVKDEAELAEAVASSISGGDAEAGRRAMEAVERRRGVVARCVADIRRMM